MRLHFFSTSMLRWRNLALLLLAGTLGFPFFACSLRLYMNCVILSLTIFRSNVIFTMNSSIPSSLLPFSTDLNGVAVVALMLRLDELKRERNRGANKLKPEIGVEFGNRDIVWFFSFESR
ncbi:unnamed protein product [Brassica oleracea]|uniref:Uncharacterized protein n=2 Tax=Brassica TaxID=3705 RepID=A0A0D2ZQC5_BRAOL|nr:unnamed protein product [Brassica napus]